MQVGKREKKFLWAAFLALAGFCLFQFGVFPLIENRDRLKRSIRVKQKDLQEMERLSNEYAMLKRQSVSLANTIRERNKGFTLFSFLEKAAGETGVKSHIKYMKPSSAKGQGPWKESMVEMKLDGISLERLMGYLYLIELSNKAITVKRCSVTESKSRKGALDVILQVITYE